MSYRPTTTKIANQLTIEEIVDMRNNIINQYADGHRMIEKAMAESNKLHNYSGIYLRDLKSPEFIKKETDQKMWRYLFDVSGMAQMMNATQKKNFNEEVENNTPEITLETVKSTMVTQYSCQDNTFVEGLIDTFRLLDKTYKSNGSFKIGKKIVFKGAACRYGFWSHYHNAPKDMMIDLQRIIHIVNKRKPPVNNDTITSKIYHALGSADVVEIDYMKVRTFKNGNVHIEIICTQTIRRINELIADYYGDQLAG